LALAAPRSLLQTVRAALALSRSKESALDYPLEVLPRQRPVAWGTEAPFEVTARALVWWAPFDFAAGAAVCGAPFDFAALRRRCEM
jgi:hypothetical protein